MSSSSATTATHDTPTAPDAAPSVTVSIPVIKTRDGSITKVGGEPLKEKNWVVWQVRMMSLLALCEVEDYVRGETKQPSMEDDPVGHANWRKNDNYAKHLITQNVSDESITYIQNRVSSYDAWKTLEYIYEDKSQETAVDHPKFMAYYSRGRRRH
jgi:hypothetical protein